MKIDEFIYIDLKKSFNVKLNRQIFSKKFFFFKKIRINKQKATPVVGITQKLENISANTYRLSSTDTILFKINPLIIKDKVVITDILKEEYLKFLRLSKAIITTHTDFENHIKVYNVPIFIFKDLRINESVNISFSIKEKELSGTNFYFDIGYGNYYFYIIFPYDNLVQSVDNIGFYGSYRVLKELIRRFLKVLPPKGFRIRILISDLLYHNNHGLNEHIKNINTDKILGVLYLQDTGIGNEKLVIKNNFYLLDTFIEKKIFLILEKIGKSVERMSMKNYSDVDIILKNIPIIWFYSYPNKFRNRLSYHFLSKNILQEKAYILFSIIQNLYREI